MTFGLITEGPTDQVVLRNILSRYLNPPVYIRSVQPAIDETDKVGLGGWQRVFEYCRSADMVSALQAYDFVIIQVDTDCCEEYGVQKRTGGIEVLGDNLVESTKQVIIEHIGLHIFAQYEKKIIFAISHDSIECWLLPLYFSDIRRTKTVSCCETLNQELRKGEFTIDCNKKQVIFYNRIFKEQKDKVKNRAQIESISVYNNSFNQFIQQLALL